MFQRILGGLVTTASLALLSTAADAQVTIDFSVKPGPDGVLGTADDLPITNNPAGGGEVVSGDFTSIGVTFTMTGVDLNIGCGISPGDSQNCLGADAASTNDFSGTLIGTFTSAGGPATVTSLGLDLVGGDTTTLYDRTGGVITAFTGDFSYSAGTPVARFECALVSSAVRDLTFDGLPEPTTIDFSHRPGLDGILGTADDVPITNNQAGGGEVGSSDFVALGVLFTTTGLALNVGCGSLSGDPLNCLGADAASTNDFSGLLIGTFTMNGGAATVMEIEIDLLGTDTTRLYDAGGGLISSSAGDFSYTGPTPVARFECDLANSAIRDLRFNGLQRSCGSITSFGTACPGNGGFLPAMAITTSCATFGESFTLDITNAEGGAQALILASAGPGSTAMGSGCIIDVSLAGFTLIFLGPLSGAGPGGGFFSAGDSFSSTGTFFLQTLIKDSVANSISTNAIELTVSP